jgi:hypothetical protein
MAIFGKGKQQNYLDMIPVRNVTGMVRDGVCITLLLPKFKSALLRKWLIPARRSPHFRIRLDENGSAVWDLINGERNAGEICDILRSRGNAEDGLEERVTGFLSQLYRNRFILFKEHV